MQVVPHITGAIVEWINRTAQEPVDGSPQRPQICMIELGGTIGDIESMPFIEALRQLKYSLPEHSLAWCHCSYIPNMSGQKTKPTQHSVKALLGLGNKDFSSSAKCRQVSNQTSSFADVQTLSLKKPGRRSRISSGLRIFFHKDLRCTIPAKQIISAHDVANLFHVPGIFAQQHMGGLLNGLLDLKMLEERHSVHGRASVCIQ